MWKPTVGRGASVERAAAAIASDTDAQNLLINNAGTAQDRSGTLEETQYYDDIRKLFEINSLGPLRVTQSVLELLLMGNPKTIVNISSLAGSVWLLTRKNQIGYTMSKAAPLEPIDSAREVFFASMLATIMLPYHVVLIPQYIIFPLLQPALVTTAIFTFIWTYNDFFSQLIYISSPKLFTISLGLRMFLDTQGESAWGAMFAMSIVSLIH